MATGFLVPMLPYAVLTSLPATPSGDSGSADTGSAMPAWEAALIQIGFVGMGLGLAVALPAYLRRRWPSAPTLAWPTDGAGLAGLRVAVRVECVEAWC